MLENLAKTRRCEDAKPSLDESFSVPSSIYIRARHGFTQYYIAGDALAPPSMAHQTADEESRTRHWLALAVTSGVPEREQTAFERECRTAQSKWVRAAEVGNPRPRGHFLRQMGQSDRELVENANLNPGVPQALLLVNSEIASAKGALAPLSPQMIHVQKSPESDRFDAVCFVLFSRKPTAEERDAWKIGGSRELTRCRTLFLPCSTPPIFSSSNSSFLRLSPS